MRLAVLAAAIAVAAAIAGEAPAHAEDPDPAAQAATAVTAVKLGEEAGELFRARKFAEALDRYERAEALVHRHTIGLRIARCYVHLGRLTEAAERYDAVIRAELPTDLDPDKLERQKEARAQAKVERDALMPRIPGVIVKVSGAKAPVVTLDGRLLPEALMGVKVAADPGPHHVEVRAGAGVVGSDVALDEGRVVPLSFALPEPVPAVTPSPPAPRPKGTAPQRRTAGFALAGAGGMALLTGIVAGGLAIAKYVALRDPSKCGNDFAHCSPSIGPEVDNYNSNREVSSIGLVAGGVLSVTGIVLVVTAPAPKDGSAAIAVGSSLAAVRGAF